MMIEKKKSEYGQTVKNSERYVRNVLNNFANKLADKRQQTSFSEVIIYSKPFLRLFQPWQDV